MGLGKQKEYWYIVIMALLSGLIVLSAQVFSDLGLSFFELSILPFIPTVIFLLPFLLFNKKYRFSLKLLPMWLLFGLISAFAVVTQFGPVLLGVPIAIVVLLLYTQPIWTMILGSLFLKEKMPEKNWLATAIVLIGVVVLVNPWGDFGNLNLLGVLVALLGGLGISGWVLMGRYFARMQLHPITIKFSETIFMFPFLAVVLPIIGRFSQDSAFTRFSLDWPIKVWLVIIAFNLLTQIVAHLLFYKGAQKVKAGDAGVIMLLEPVSAALLAKLIFGQPITFNIIVGGFLIIFANYLIINGSAKKEGAGAN